MCVGENEAKRSDMASASPGRSSAPTAWKRKQPNKLWLKKSQQAFEKLGKLIGQLDEAGCRGNAAKLSKQVNAPLSDGTDVTDRLSDDLLLLVLLLLFPAALLVAVRGVQEVAAVSACHGGCSAGPLVCAAIGGAGEVCGESAADDH